LRSLLCGGFSVAWAAQASVKVALKLVLALKVPEKHPKSAIKNFATPNQQRARLAKCHGLRVWQEDVKALRDPKPVALPASGPLRYTAICDPHFCRLPPMDLLWRPTRRRMSEPGCPLWRDTLGCVFSMAWAAQTAVKSPVKARNRLQSARKAPENKQTSRPKMGCFLRVSSVTDFAAGKALSSSFQNRTR
jgi:hypothetical protein